MLDTYDILVVGGGINGTAIARDAAGRGLTVMLCERDDLAAHTSSSSTKLIHGGLRYLEYYEFRLVREALKEREVLLKAAPHIIHPMRFVLPYDKGLRPAWMLRIGLLIYDHLGGQDSLPNTRKIDLTEPPFAGVLEERLRFGFEYSDCWVEDARLVVLNAMAARELGAVIRTHTAVGSIEAGNGFYNVEIQSSGEPSQTVRAKAVVNSAGPWVDQIYQKLERKNTQTHLRLIKGSHIVTGKLFEGEHAFIFQNDDERIIFAIPYEDDYTLIGTTDVPYSHDEGAAKISPEEIDYLCEAASEYFAKDITKEDVLWTYSGVRPLYDDMAEDAAAVTRDYVLRLDEFADAAPFISVYGGKITTSRKLAEHAMDKLSKFFPGAEGAWTAGAPLPGGDMKNGDFDAFFADAEKRYPWISAGHRLRMCRSYGTKIYDILGDAASYSDLGKDFGQGLFAAEVRYLIEHEWATTAEDILWRRTKLGLHMSAGKIKAVENWLQANA